MGRDPDHLRSVRELQSGLRKTIKKIRFRCKKLPAELPEWERVANLHGPGF